MPTEKPPAISPPDTSPIFRLIGRTRRAMRSGAFLTGSSLTLGLAAGVLVAACLADVASPMRPSARLLALFVIVVPTCWALVAKLALPLLRRLGPVQVARTIEGRLPGIHNRLVSCVDLSRPDREKERASAFFAKLVREALDRIKEFRPWSVVDRRRLTRASIFGAGAVGAFVLTFGVLPEAMSSAMARIFHPFADIAPATGVKFAVKPGNAKALRGEDVTIEVAVERGKADDLRVELRRADGEGGTTWYDLDRPSESGGSLRLAAFESSFTYRVHGGGTWSPEYVITMLDRPAITSLAASVRYPAYMGIAEPKPGAPQIGDVTGPEKSTVTVAVETTGDVATGSIQSLVDRTKTVAVLDRPERVWQVLEFIPEGSAPDGPWQWDFKRRGRPSHFDPLNPGLHGHRVSNLPPGFRVMSGESLFAYVYLPPEKLPETLALQWHDGATWEHRAYWGADKFPAGQDGTPTRRKMGAIPSSGGWVRLEVPAKLVDFEGKELRGISFDAVGGEPLWGRAGTVPPREVEATELVVAQSFRMTKGENGRWVGEFSLDQSGSYRVELKNELGYANKTMKAAKITAIPDLPPQVVVERPGSDLVMKVPAKVPLVLSAYDDFGLAEIVISTQKGESGGFVGRPVKRFEKPVRNETVVTALDLPSMELKAGDVVRYRVEARDRKGQSAQTREFLVRIADDGNAADAQLAQFEKTQDGFQEKLAKLIAEQAKVRDSVKALPAKYEPLRQKIEAAAKAAPDKPPAGLDPESVKALAELRAEMAKLATQEQQNASLAEQVANELNAASENAPNQKLLPPQITQGLKAAASEFRDAAVNPLQEITAAMKAGADASKAAPNVPALDAATAGLQRELEAMKARLDALARAEKALKNDPVAAVEGLKNDQAKDEADRSKGDLADLKEFLAKLREDLKAVENKEEQVVEAARTAPDLLLPDVKAKQGEVEKEAEAKLADAKAVHDGGQAADLKKMQDFPKAPYTPDGREVLVPPEEEDADDAPQKNDPKAEAKKDAKADDDAEADPKDSMPNVGGDKAKLDPRFADKMRPVAPDEKVKKAGGMPPSPREAVAERGQQTLKALAKAEGQVAADEDAVSKAMAALSENDPHSLSERMQAGTVKRAKAMASRLQTMRATRAANSQTQPEGGKASSASLGNLKGSPQGVAEAETELAKLDPNTRTVLLKMPPRVREELLQGMKEDGPEGYGKFIQDYFKKLSEVKPPG